MKFTAAILLLLLCPFMVAWGQVKAGSEEDHLFTQITSAPNVDARIELISSFEQRFPQSPILARIYLMAVDAYREKNDRLRVNEYGEKVLKLDDSNITAMMVLSRSYAMESANLDRAITLAHKAMDRLKSMREGPVPAGYSSTQWEDYLKANEAAAQQIVQYVDAINARSNLLKNAPANGTAGK